MKLARNLLVNNKYELIFHERGVGGCRAGTGELDGAEGKGAVVGRYCGAEGVDTGRRSGICSSADAIKFYSKAAAFLVADNRFEAFVLSLGSVTECSYSTC